MGNFEKLSVLVIVVIIVMILVVAIYEWTGSPSEPTPATQSASVGGGGSSAQLRAPAPDPFIIDPAPRPAPAPAPNPAPRNGAKPGPVAPAVAPEDPWDMNGDWSKGPLIPDPSPTPAPVPTPTPTPDGTPAPAPAPNATEIPETVHVVVSGDTLGEISKKYYHRASLYTRIMDANPGVTPESLREGTKLKIPALRIEASTAPVGPSSAPEALAASGERPIPGKEYKVRRGDTWQSISKIAFNSIERWPEIYVRNMKKVKTQSDLAVGLVISIPK